MLAYLMGDVPEDLRREVLQLELALERPDLSGIVLWDDFCGQAGHTITALAQWLDEEESLKGVIDEGLLLNERLAFALGKERAERFRATPITLAFAMATPLGIKNLKSALKALKLDNVTVMKPQTLVLNDDELARDERVFRDPGEQTDFYRFVETKAREIHAPRTKRKLDPWDETKVNSRLRGYGNWSARLAFFYNVPTVTLTVLWDRGPSWKPLLPRRSKPHSPHLGTRSENA